MASKCINIIVKGKVQGVFFRASTCAKAQSLGLTGYVRNQYDGSVLIAAEGKKDQLKLLEKWCRAGGPPGAQVTEIKITEEKLSGWEDFTIKR